MTPARFPRLQTASLAILVLAVVLMGRVRDYTLSDPQLTLLTSQVLWERHTIDLRPELDRLGPKEFAKDTWKYSINSRGQVFYGYPLGTSLIALPVVALGRTLGSDLAVWDTDRRYQIALAGLCSAAVFFLLAEISWRFHPEPMSVIFAFVVTLGSSLVSTLGSALWSFDLELVFALLAFREVARAESAVGESPRAFRLGLFLAVAWICRPSAATLALPVGLFMLARGWRGLLSFGAGILVVILPFLAFCRVVTGSYFASYYAAGHWIRVSDLANWPANLEAILLSPARGLFVFTPALVFGVIALALPGVRRRPAARVLFGWVSLTIALVATQRNWWGGWSFGPRLLTEVVPGLALLTLMGWTAVTLNTQRRLIGIVALCLGWGVLVHTGQGLYFRAAYAWNNRPNIDAASEYYRHNWSFPQFLATAARNDAKAEAHGR